MTGPLRSGAMAVNNIDVRNLIVWAIIGILAGWIASLIVGGTGGLLGYLIFGLIGSLVGGWLARRFDIRFNVGSAFIEQMIVSVIGAILVLVVWRIIT